MALRETGEFGPAVDCFVKAAEMKARNARQYLNKGNALFQIDKLDEALACFQKAISIENNFYEAYLNMGVVLNELGRTVEELDCYNKVLEIKPGDVKALYNQGVAKREVGDIEGSLVSFEKVINLEPNMLNAHINKGLSYYILGQFKESYNCYKIALDIDNNSIETYINMSQCLRSMKKSNRALKLLQKGLRMNPSNSELHFYIGEIYREILNIKKALEFYTKAIQLNPIYSEAVFQKGICLQIINELDSATKCFDLCIKFNPSYAKPHINKGQIYEVQGKMKSALRQYELAATLKNGQEGDDIALLCKAHVFRERVGDASKRSAIEIYNNLINRQNYNQTTKFQAYLGYSAIVIKEILMTNLQALGRFLPVTGSYVSSQASSVVSLNTTQINKQLPSQQLVNINLSKQNDIDFEQQKKQYQIQNLAGAEVDDAYFHLFCLLASEIERLTTFTSQELQKIQDDQHQDFTLSLMLRYLNLKKKQGLGSLGMGNAKHIIYMIMSYIYIGLKKREKKEYDESILYFEFLMNLDRDLELFCRFQSFISFLQSSYFQNNCKKIQFPLAEQITKGTNSEIFEICFDKDSIMPDFDFQEDDTPQKSQGAQQQQQQLKLSSVSKQLLESFEKELICRKIKAAVFKVNKEHFYREFAMQNILNHRNIQKINYMYFDSDENLYYIEPRQKYNLEAHLHQYIVSFEQRLNILLQICQAIQYLHSNGIVHGCISMKNILIRNGDFLPLLTDFHNSRIFLNTYHSSSFQNIQQYGNKQSSAFFQSNPTNDNFTSPDMTISLSSDIFSLGQVFEKMLLKIDQQDRMINNWYKKGFTVSLPLQKMIRSMLDHNKLYKRPDIKRVVEALQIEIIAAMLYNIYEGPFQAHQGQSSLQGSASKNNSVMFNSPNIGGISNNSMRNVFHPQTHSQSANSSGLATPANNVSAKTLLQQQLQSIQHHSIVDSNSYSHVNTPMHSISQANPPNKLSRKQIKKLIPFTMFFSEFDDIRQYNKQALQLKVIPTHDINAHLIEKMNKVLNFSYVNVQDLLNRDLFLNSLNEINLNFLVIIIKQIEDCTTSQQVKLIKDFLEAINERKKRLETENIYQYSQARLLYRLIGRSDPEKYRYKLMQKAQFKDQYISIASVFLSDGVDTIENNLRSIFLDILPIHVYQVAKKGLNNFTFPIQYSVQKKKLAIMEKFQEVISCLQIPQSELDKIQKDSVNQSKLLQILKFDGYLRDIGEGVYDLLFKPMRDLIEKIFVFSKIESQFPSDSQQIPQITAKQYYQQKIRSIAELEREIEKVKKAAHDYLTSSIARKSGININIETLDENNKKITPQISPLDKSDKNLANQFRKNTNKDHKSSPSLMAKLPSLKSLSQLEDVPSNYGQKRTDKKNLAAGLPVIGKQSMTQLHEIEEQHEKPDYLSSLVSTKQKSKGDQQELNENVQEELQIAAPRSIVNIVVEEANNHIRQLKLYKKQQQQQQQQQNNDDSATNRETNFSTRNTTNNQSENTITQPNTERKVKKIQTDRKSQSPTKPSTTSRNLDSKIPSSSNISAFDEKKSPLKQMGAVTQSTTSSTTQQNLQQSQQQQNSYLATSHADLIEEENYNQFIKNHLKQNLFGEPTTSTSIQNNQNNSKSSSTRKIQSSLNNIQTDNDDEDSDEQLDQMQTVTITTNLNKNQQKLASIGGGLKNQQSNSQSNSEKRNLVVEQIKMKKLNFSGIKSGESITSFEKKAPNSSLIKKSISINNRNVTLDDEQMNEEGRDAQREIKLQFMNQNGTLNQKVSLMENVFSVEFNDLKNLYDNSLDL